VIVYISIGNSDDKLTQAEWSSYFHRVNRTLDLDSRVQLHGCWTSNSASRWQNACWCVELLDDIADRVKGKLRKLAAEYRQDSIAWAEAPETEFIGPEAAR